MKVKPVLWTMASIAMGAALIYSLISFAKIDPRVTLHQLSAANRIAFVRLMLLMALHIFLSSQKWRLMDAVLCRPGDKALSRSAFFAFTSIGVALGQILPAMGMVIARVFGTKFHGRAVTRGSVAALVDQGSDFLLVCFLIPASVITRIFAPGPIAWIALAAVMAGILLVTASLMIGMVRHFAAYLIDRGAASRRWCRALNDTLQSGLLDASLVRKLLSLSMLRFAVLVFMAGETSRAIGAAVPLWELAASMPFVVVATAVAITPGGIGLNELTYTTGLTTFGTPLALAAQWALANRVLTAAAAFGVAGCTLITLLLWKCQRVFREDEALVVPESMSRATHDA